MGYAKISLAGNIGRSPEKRYTPNGRTVSQFSVAVTRGKDDARQVDWYSVSCWGDLADTVAATFTKGSKVKVEGRLQQREYTAKDGTKKVSIEVIADTVVADDKQWAPATDSDTIPF